MEYLISKYIRELLLQVNEIIQHKAVVVSSVHPAIGNIPENAFIIVDAHCDAPLSNFGGIDIVRRAREDGCINPIIILSWFSYSEIMKSSLYFKNVYIAKFNVVDRKNCGFLQLPVFPQEITDMLQEMNCYEY